MANSYIVTSKTLSQLKQKARDLKKSAGIPHHVALEQVAKGIGLPNWHKVAESAEITAQTEKAYLSGLIVAFDMKDAGSFDPANIFIEDQQALAFCEKDLLASFRKACEDEGEPATEEEVEDYRNELHWNHVLFRYVGHELPLTVRDALSLIYEKSFWAPLYVWLKGSFYETGYEGAQDDEGEIAGIRF